MEELVAQPQVALPGVPAIGEVLAEKYRVEGILGVGGMGVVLGARHLQLGQLVAIKVLSVSAEHQGDAVERFLREGRAAAALNSDHVVRIYDVGQLPNGLPFMVMERLRGQDLSSRLTDLGPLAIADAVEYVAQAAMAIVEAHEVGIVHRDLKPANLFLTHRSDGSACVKVLDFGISKQLTDLESKTLQGSLTSTRQVMGSPAYMSPEQVRDAKNVDHRTDIWALGVTLYELLTRCAAFDADTLPAVCAAIAADPPIPIRSRRPEVPDAVEAIIVRCLEKQPANRYPSARALLVALRGYQGKAADSGPRIVEGAGPLTEASTSPEGGLPRSAQSQSELGESGARSVDSVRQVAVDGTLVSGRSPLIGVKVENAPAASEGRPKEPETTPAASDGKPEKHWQRLAIVALAVFVLGGAATGWYVTSRSSPTAPPAAAAIGEQPAAKAPNGQQPAAERTHFVLGIVSEPSQALVLEGGNPVGVTPLSIEIDRTVVQRSARQFVVRKPGFMEVGIQQGDSLTDVQQNVSLAKVEATKPASLGAKSPTMPQAKRPSAASSPAPSSPAPGIRITR